MSARLSGSIVVTVPSFSQAYFIIIVSLGKVKLWQGQVCSLMQGNTGRQASIRLKDALIMLGNLPNSYLKMEEITQEFLGIALLIACVRRMIFLFVLEGT